MVKYLQSNQGEGAPHCASCRSPLDAQDNFCRHCGKETSGPYGGGRNGGSASKRRFSSAFFIGLCVIFSLFIGVVAHESDYGQHGGLWREVGELFSREQMRQRELRHEAADGVENGPKEISIHCPQNPTVRITDLDEDDRNRDECLVLHLSGPDVSSRLVLFCSASSKLNVNSTVNTEEL